MLFDEDDEVFSSDLKEDDRLADHHYAGEDVSEIEVGNLCTSLRERIRHSNESIVDADEEVLLGRVLSNLIRIIRRNLIADLHQDID